MCDVVSLVHMHTHISYIRIRTKNNAKKRFSEINVFEHLVIEHVFHLIGFFSALLLFHFVFIRFYKFLVIVTNAK